MHSRGRCVCADCPARTSAAVELQATTNLSHVGLAFLRSYPRAIVFTITVACRTASKRPLLRLVALLRPHLLARFHFE
ncbi:hypothetical protein EXIGLDRAFT_723986 [Exidia glandulosa HHB12029]|uniref:Uncharacterized protein n=1 Tax=Exidia glandulosa HHB12029 TaxID=1314781 RepID=A0A165ELM5_EXIGL|nr:hypothetical protein EXIGLDRAFT_723986 [Exidia glandulosa HHB12029]